ncbi:MAG: hypothetical protein KIH63_005505 [Candidatus Saccharibacteria bacterium]|nr:hypothetical protein [Candidatus Saccharibacteria bacterium]
MSKWPSSDYIFTLLDFADDLAPRITDEEMFKHQYFITLIQIEYVLDSYGRGLVLYEARERGLPNAEALFKEAERRMDALRLTIRRLAQTYDFDDTLREYTDMILRDWKRSSEDNRNATNVNDGGRST